MRTTRKSYMMNASPPYKILMRYKLQASPLKSEGLWQDFLPAAHSPSVPQQKPMQSWAAQKRRISIFLLLLPFLQAIPIWMLHGESLLQSQLSENSELKPLFWKLENKTYCVRFEGFTVVSIVFVLFWVLAPCFFIDQFGDKYCLHRQVRSGKASQPTNQKQKV